MCVKLAVPDLVLYSPTHSGNLASCKSLVGASPPVDYDVLLKQLN